ncbi:MAG: hypothetical protein IKX19_10060, partial [Clostridia bacterium]|nr:hypothetical protein [Clostridia bacterium]
TWAEMLDFLDILPVGIYAGERMYNRTVLDTWFGGYEAFLDEEAGTCSFDSPLFIRALKFAGNLGDWKTARVRDPIESMDPEERNRLYYTGKAALKLVRFASERDAFAGRELIFGSEDWVPIGYPSADGRVPGNRINAGLAFAILNSSEAKDEAWSLISAFMKGGGQRTSDTLSIPALRSRFRELTGKWIGGHLEMFANGSTAIAAAGTSGGSDYMRKEYGEPYLEKDLTPDCVAWFEEFCDRPVMPLLSKAPADLTAIVNEELSEFFAGAISAEDCAARIQSRASIWMAEHR